MERENTQKQFEQWLKNPCKSIDATFNKFTEKLANWMTNAGALQRELVEQCNRNTDVFESSDHMLKIIANSSDKMLKIANEQMMKDLTTFNNRN